MLLRRVQKISFFSAVIFSIFSLAPKESHAQSVVAPSAATDVLDESLLQSSPIAKTYMARVLLENHENWKEAYELLRGVLKNHKDEVPSVVLKKIERAAKQVARFLPETYVRKALNRRHLIRPFLEAQYLLNEALMDWRIALNTSSDSETVFVEKLFQSYFFPGFEDRGTLLYPDPNTYSFNIFALTPENVQRARRHKSTDKDPRQGGYTSPYPSSPPISGGGGSPYIPRPPGVPGVNPTPVPPFNPPGGGTGPGTPVSPWPRPPGSSAGRGPVDWDNPAFNVKLYQANGFIDDALKSGIDLGDITEEVVRIMKQFKISDRVTNRYLEQALLMQAIADPGSIFFDPQLQEFLKGMRLSVYLGDVPAESASEWDVLRDTLGADLVTRDKEGNVRIKMSGLVAQERPGSEQGLDIRLQQVDGEDRQRLYVISSIAGPDLLRLRTFMALTTLFRDWDAGVKVARTAAGVISQTQAYAFLAKTSKLVIDFSKIGVSEASRVMMWIIRIVYYTVESIPGIKAASLQQIRELLRTAALTISRGGVEKFTKLGKWVSPKVKQSFNWVKNQKHIKNGNAANALIILALAAETAIIAVEYKHAKDENQKYEILMDGGARVGATLTYALPVVGLGAAIVDLSHTFLGLPFETADAFRAYRHGVENLAYRHYAGMNKLEFDLLEQQQSLNLPRNAFYIEKFAKNVSTLEKARQNVIELDQQIQDISARYLVHLYLAHRRIAPKRENVFGRKQEDYMREFAGNLLSYSRTKAELVSLLSTLQEDAGEATDGEDDDDSSNLIPMPGIDAAEAEVPPASSQPRVSPFVPSFQGSPAVTNGAPEMPRIILPLPSVSTNRTDDVNIPGRGPKS